MSPTTTKPVYLYPGKVRDWVKEQVYKDKHLYKRVNSNKWVDRSWAYHHLSDLVLDHFQPFVSHEIDIKNFDRLVLDYVDGHRQFLVPPNEGECEWPNYDPEKFQEGEFYID